MSVAGISRLPRADVVARCSGLPHCARPNSAVGSRPQVAFYCRTPTAVPTWQGRTPMAASRRSASRRCRSVASGCLGRRHGRGRRGWGNASGAAGPAGPGRGAAGSIRPAHRASAARSPSEFAPARSRTSAVLRASPVPAVPRRRSCRTGREPEGRFSLHSPVKTARVDLGPLFAQPRQHAQAFRVCGLSDGVLDRQAPQVWGPSLLRGCAPSNSHSSAESCPCSKRIWKISRASVVVLT